MAALAAPPTVWAAEDMIEPGVAHTARWTAAMRFMEHERPDALICDPLARAFAGESAVEKWRKEMNDYEIAQPNARSHIAIRARAVDDIMAAEIEAMLPADLVQVVCLGAGMCTRPWRIAAPDAEVIWFEVDRPDSIRLKVATVNKQTEKPSVGSTCYIGQDFSDPTVSLTALLEENNFDPHAPTIFVMEGLLPYLEVNDVQALAEEVYELCEGNVRLVMTVINDGFYTELKNPSVQTQQKYPGTSEVSCLFHSSWEDGIQDAFQGAGWQQVSIISREDYATQILGVEMIMYSFPDRATSTEYIIVMGRPAQGVRGLLQRFGILCG